MEIKIVMKILLLAFMHQNEKENLFVVGVTVEWTHFFMLNVYFVVQCLILTSSLM